MADPVFRTVDMLKWGAGLGRNLTPVEGDTNIWDFLGRIRALEALNIGVGFDTGTSGAVSISGNQLTFHFSDSTSETVTLPDVLPGSVGDWAALTFYAAFSFVRDPDTNKIYIVLFPHTSAATFDPGANDGSGHDYYGLWLDPLITFGGLSDVELSTGVAEGQFMRIHVDTSGTTFYNDDANFSDLLGQISVTQYPAGLKPTSQTVTLATDGSLDIDLALGTSVHVTLGQDVSAFTVTGWPTTGTAGELNLIITNTGSFAFLALPSGTLTPGGTIPALTPSVTAGDGQDEWSLRSDDAGTIIRLSVTARNYLAP